MLKKITMKSITKNIFRAFSVIMLLAGSVYTVVWDTSKVWFSDFTFSYLGTNYTPTLNLTLTWWIETWFYFSIYNKEDTPMSYAFSFVDGYYTSPDSLKACKSQTENNVFWQYISWNVNTLTIASYDTWTRYFTVKFPNNYSWLYMWCVMYYPITTGDSNEVITLPRRGWFIDAQLSSITKEFTLTVKPAFRASNNTPWYSIANADFWIFVYENSTWTGIYNSSKNPLDAKITTDSHGLGMVSFIPPASGTLYLMAYKGSWTLSLWFTWIRNDDIDTLNFFSWTLAATLSNEFMFDYNNEYYLKVGDTVADDIWTYDFIKDPDFTLMTNYLTISWTPLHPSRFDLDSNDTINALEQTMLLDSYNRRWFITTQTYIPVADFVIL